MDRETAVARGVECGIAEELAGQVVDAYTAIGQRLGREFDPATWSNTVWQAEAARWQRSKSAAAHADLVLHLADLSSHWESMFKRGARGWTPGRVGERLTKR